MTGVSKELVVAQIYDIEEKQTQAGKAFGKINTSAGYLNCFDVELCKEIQNKLIGKTAELEISVNDRGFKNLIKVYATDKKLGEDRPSPSTSFHASAGARIGCAFNNATNILIKQGFKDEVPLAVQVGNLARELIAAMKTIESEQQ